MNIKLIGASAFIREAHALVERVDWRHEGLCVQPRLATSATKDTLAVGVTEVCPLIGSVCDGQREHCLLHAHGKFTESLWADDLGNEMRAPRN